MKRSGSSDCSKHIQVQMIMLAWYMCDNSSNSVVHSGEIVSLRF